MTSETILALTQAALEAAAITKNEIAEEPGLEIGTDAAYEQIIDRWDNQDLAARKRGWRKGLRSDELPQPDLGAPALFQAAYEAALEG